MKFKNVSMATLLALGCSMAFAQTVEIGTWAGFRKGAVSFSFDDGPKSDIDVAAPMFKKYGYTATFNIVTGWVGKDGMLSWNDIKSLASAGHEIASHSDSHPTGTMPSNEISSSKQKISSQVQQDYGCITLAYPNCNTPGDQQVLQSYIAGRICNGSWKGGSDIMGKDGPNNWAALSAIMTGTQGNSDFKGLMQKAVSQGGWVMFLTHGFSGATNGMANYSPTDASSMESGLQWASQNDKDVWVAPTRNITMYVKERNSSKAEASTSGDAITVKLTHTIADNISKYDYPLSLRVKSDWSKVEVTQANATLESKVDSGYVYFDAVPNAGDVVIKNANAAPQPVSSSSVQDSLVSSSSEAPVESSSSESTLGIVDFPNSFHVAVYRSSDNYIVVSGAQGMSVTVFNSLGHKLRATRALGLEQKVFTGAKGVYIVKVGGKSWKVKL